MNRKSMILNLIIFFGICHYTIAKEFGKDIRLRDNENSEKLRVCIVEGRGAYKKAEKHCPALESSSNFECVIGSDRLDCVRRIHKGSAHFGVFSSEDLVAARWAGVEILVTNEMRFHSEAPFEYEIVAIVDNEAGINSVHDLSGSRFCHPGHGFQDHWTEVLANYFESTLVPRQCEIDLTLAESRIKASAKFFGPTCKAGPWVPDPAQDRILKNKYPSLCEICDNPYQCAIGDKHWGRYGPLYCLTSGTGQVAWARLDDVKFHFGFSGLPAQADPSGFSFLCPDGHLQPITSLYPCVWVAKPWPAVAVKRTAAEKVHPYLDRLSHNDLNSWENALLSLLENYHVNVTALDNAIPVDDYLDQAVGFQGAYSFPACNPPRSIIYCTTTLIAHVKCSWLQEAAGVYGIEPNLQCIRTESIDRCMDDTKHNYADVVLVDHDDRVRAERDFNLRPILYELAPTLEDRYSVVAVIKENSGIKHLSDLRGKKACFPSFEGAAYLSVMETLKNKSLTSTTCEYSNEVETFFSSESCIWESPSQNCHKSYYGDQGALKCLADGGDVAFISADIYQNFTKGDLATLPWSIKLNQQKVKLLCPYGETKTRYFKSDICFLHWAPRGHLMIHNNTSLMRGNEIYNSLREMDRLFGKQVKSLTMPFTMFGPFDRRTNVMFRDTTEGLRGLTELKRDKIYRDLEQTYVNFVSRNCTLEPSSGKKLFIINGMLLVSIICSLLKFLS